MSSQHASPSKSSNPTSGAPPSLLRGLIDAGDYKQFIFPLLFFKRLSRCLGRGVRSGARRIRRRRGLRALRREPPLPDPRRRALERRARRPRRTSARRIQTAMRAIETANPDRLDGIFGDAAVDQQGPPARRHAART